MLPFRPFPMLFGRVTLQLINFEKSRILKLLFINISPAVKRPGCTVNP